MTHSIMEEAVLWLEGVPLYGHKDGLNNMFRLMGRLGDPQDKLKVIHVAGTNGKGSCCAMLQRILMESGFKVGLYTSPHLVDYRERIRVGDELIDPASFVRLLNRVRQTNNVLVKEGYPHATFFEFVTAVAFLYFAEQKVDYIVLEVGVGGRLDATNIVKAPIVSLITSISFDHVKTLGDTLPLIAAEKAGIIKQGRPVVSAANPEEVRAVLREKAARMEAPYCEAEEGSFSKGGYELALAGDYQQENAEAVLKVVHVLQDEGVAIPEEAVYNGLARTVWPGRMQRITWRNKEFILEGAHNPDAAGILGRWIHKQEKPCGLVFGALRKKDALGVLQGIMVGQERIQKIYFTPIEGADSLDADEMNELMERLGLSVPWQPFAHAREALEAAAQSPDSPVIIAGSLYLIGEVLTCFHFPKN